MQSKPLNVAKGCATSCLRAYKQLPSPLPLLVMSPFLNEKLLLSADSMQNGHLAPSFKAPQKSVLSVF